MKLTDFTKTSAFGLIGGAGALIGTLIFELLIPALPVAPPPPILEVCLLIDCSGSMDEKSGGQKNRLEEVKESAKRFIDQNISKGEIAVVGFNTHSIPASPLSKDPQKLKAAVDGLKLDGSTAMDLGLLEAAEQFSYKPNSLRYIFLFTDGVPDLEATALEAGMRIKGEQGRATEIVAVGTGGADMKFLNNLSEKSAISATSGQFDLAFKEVENAIYTQHAMGMSTATTASPTRLVLHYGSWAALLAIGITLALIVAQNRSLHRRLLNFSQAATGTLGAIIAGMIAGAIGQLLFSLASSGMITDSSNPLVVATSRTISWALLGGLLGFGMRFVIPNLKTLRAMVGGMVGGAVGAVGFIIASAALGDWLGRLVGCAMLGFFIGLMVAIVEVMFREAWLEIRYGPKELRTVSLGNEPITFGSDQNACTIYARDAAPMAYSYWIKDNVVSCQDVVANRTMSVLPGDSKQVGAVMVTVCGTGKGLNVAQPGAAGALCLHLSSGRSIPLLDGLKLTSSDLPGLECQSPGDPVALVSRHPSDPKIQGLQNLSRVPWRVRLVNGDTTEVKPGKSIRLVANTRIDFGKIHAEVRA